MIGPAPGRPPRLEPGAVIISSMRATASPAIGRKCSGRCSASTPRPYTLLWRTAGARSRQPCSSTGTAWPTYCAAPAAARARGRSGARRRPGAAGKGRRPAPAVPPGPPQARKHCGRRHRLPIPGPALGASRRLHFRRSARGMAQHGGGGRDADGTALQDVVPGCRVGSGLGARPQGRQHRQRRVAVLAQHGRQHARQLVQQVLLVLVLLLRARRTRRAHI